VGKSGYKHSIGGKRKPWIRPGFCNLLKVSNYLFYKLLIIGHLFKYMD
jgi:hypothetical protein